MSKTYLRYLPFRTLTAAELMRSKRIRSQMVLIYIVDGKVVLLGIIESKTLNN